MVGFAEGLIDFTGRFGEGSEEEAVQIVNLKVRILHSNALFSRASALTRGARCGEFGLQKRCFCFHSCEPDVWLVAVLKEPTGIVGDGSDRYSVNSSAVRTLLRLMYQTFALFQGTIKDALTGSKVSSSCKLSLWHARA